MASISIRRPMPAGSPSFIGLVRGELFKLLRQRTTWIVLALLTGFVILPWFATIFLGNAKTNLTQEPLPFLFREMGGVLSTLRVFSGFAISILTARIIGLDYQLGTIRITLARGVERLQLLGAKLVTVLVAALAILVGGLALNYLLMVFDVRIISGSLSALSSLNGFFWGATWDYILTVVISLVATALMVTAATVVGRSLTFGMAVGLSFFAADNFASIVSTIIAAVTNNDFWLKLTAYFLGPNLNYLPYVMVPGLQATATSARGGLIHRTFNAFSFGPTPAVSYDLTHTLVIIALYTVAFVVVSVILTWRKDVME